nr:DUF5372 family protein [Microvirga lotononidis]
MTHPFHPLSGQKLALVSRGCHWGEDRVVYRGPDGVLRTIAAAWTDLDPPDEFRRVAAGRAAFRTVDLLALCTLLDRLALRPERGKL